MPSSGNRILSIAFDLAQYIWIGRQSGGVYRLNFSDNNWTSYPPHSLGGRLPDGAVNTICTDLQHKRWFGTQSGLVELNDTAWTSFTSADNSFER